MPRDLFEIEMKRRAISREEAKKYGVLATAVLEVKGRFPSPGGAIGMLFPKFGRVVTYYVPTWCGGSYKVAKCGPYGYIYRLIARVRSPDGKVKFSKEYTKVPTCMLPRFLFLDTEPGDIVEFVAWVSLHARDTYASNGVIALYGLVDELPNAIAIDINDAYLRWLTVQCMAKRGKDEARLLGELLTSKMLPVAFFVPYHPQERGKWVRVFDAPIVGNANVDFSPYPVIEARFSPMAINMKYAIESCNIVAMGSKVRICGESIDGQKRKCIEKINVPTSGWDYDFSKTLDLNQFGGVARVTIDIAPADKDAALTPGWVLLEGGALSLYPATMTTAAGGFVNVISGWVTPALFPKKIDLCLGKADSFFIKTLVRSRVRIESTLFSYEGEHDKGNVRIRVPYPPPKPSDTLKLVVEGLEGFLPKTSFDMNAFGAVLAGNKQFGIATPTGRAVFVPPRLETKIPIELKWPELRASLDAPKMLEPLQKARVSLRVENAGTCVGRFVASLMGAKSEKELEPGQAIELSKEVEMKAGDIEVPASAELVLPSQRVTRHLSAKIKMINTVWFRDDGALVLRNGGAENKIDIGIAAVRVNLLYKTGELANVPLPIAVAHIDAKPYEDVVIAKAMLPRAIIVHAKEPIWLVVHGKPIKKDTTIVWYEGPDGMLAVRVLAEAMGLKLPIP